MGSKPYSVWLDVAEQIEAATIARDYKNRYVYMRCACCGKGFRGWQHPQRDDGFGICAGGECEESFGYQTEF